MEESKKVVRVNRDSFCNRFNDNVRMTIIGLQEAGISASKCPTVIDTVGPNLFEEKLGDLPSISTSANISDESHFISKNLMLKKRSCSHHMSHSIQMGLVGKNRGIWFSR